jgi:hypothetical protein
MTVDPLVIGRGNPPGSLRQPPYTTIYLGWDRYSALADFLLRKYGLEVPVSFDMPNVTFLPAATWSALYPDRYVISAMEGDIEISANSCPQKNIPQRFW